MLDADAAHNTSPDMIANLEEGAADQGHTITATVSADGAFHGDELAKPIYENLPSAVNVAE